MIAGLPHLGGPACHPSCCAKIRPNQLLPRRHQLMANCNVQLAHRTCVCQIQFQGHAELSLLRLCFLTWTPTNPNILVRFPHCNHLGSVAKIFLPKVFPTGVPLSLGLGVRPRRRSERSLPSVPGEAKSNRSSQQALVLPMLTLLFSTHD